MHHTQSQVPVSVLPFYMAVVLACLYARMLGVFASFFTFHITHTITGARLSAALLHGSRPSLPLCLLRRAPCLFLSQHTSYGSACYR